MEADERDFFARRLTRRELEELARKAGGMAKIFAFGSPAFRKLGLDPAEVAEEQMLEMALAEPRLLRRPIAVVGDRVLVGGKAVREASS